MDVPRNMGSKMENVALLSALMVVGVRNSLSTQPAPMMLAIPSSAMDCVAALAAALRPTEGTALAMPLRVLAMVVLGIPSQGSSNVCQRVIVVVVAGRACMGKNEAGCACAGLSDWFVLSVCPTWAFFQFPVSLQGVQRE